MINKILYSWRIFVNGTWLSMPTRTSLCFTLSLCRYCVGGISRVFYMDAGHPLGQ